jgi:hypothetical protein
VNDAVDFAQVSLGRPGSAGAFAPPLALDRLKTAIKAMASPANAIVRPNGFRNITKLPLHTI